MPLQKTCNKCKQDKPVADFYANKRMKDGINTFCIQCHKKDNIERKAKNRMDENFKQSEREYKKIHRVKNSAKHSAYMQQWRKNNQTHMQSYGKKYRAENRAFVNFLCQKRKIALVNRTPVWLSEDDLWVIKEAYALAEERTRLFGFPWHVDHIVPLRGKSVSGLHVPYNLQVIPAVENMQKTNRYEV
jgi:hypothetical protein